ncbi:MAG: tRNA 5-methoxyuridine(34)/uridine 5-oxyacetic acid(34) synthase CmoB, partial [Proteobacteria bacterium]|nr:tRNA 5-methoxyuridine(34)/uridine 5-oxyacetic acid(34) synthase CmoB [Pseudomonadota bacterium]
SRIDLNQDVVVIGDTADINNTESEQLINVLKTFMPWRKGPFSLFGINIDAEWQSNLKWDRLKDQIEPLNDKLILDIGCGNGYYGWRMLGQGAKYVVGMDPTLLFYMQFQVFKKYIPDAKLNIIPLGIQSLPEYPLIFDTVFSMGVIYHRRDPAEHLQQLINCLNPGGQLVLESLIIESNDTDVLEPDGRYAKMNNVWAIPNINTLTSWVKDAGFRDIRIIDVTKTGTDEQRVTEWMQFESLADYLDGKDENKTIEGYPAPVRAILVAYK